MVAPTEHVYKYGCIMVLNCQNMFVCRVYTIFLLLKCGLLSTEQFCCEYIGICIQKSILNQYFFRKIS